MKITGEMHFSKALAALKKDGVEVADIAPGELYALAEAARRCADPFSAVNAELAGHPVQVGHGVWLWPLTIGAQLWLDEHAEKWWKAGGRMWILAIVYAMRHAREPRAFAGLTERWRATEEVLRSALTLPVRLEELVDAICRANGLPAHGAAKPESSRDRRREDQAQRDFAAIVSRLEVESGIPRSVWIWERSLMYTFTAYAQLHAFAEAYSPRGERRPKMLDELDEAMTHLAAVKAGIAQGARHKNQDGGAARG